MIDVGAIWGTNIEDAEKRLIVADPSKMDSTLIDSTLIK